MLLYTLTQRKSVMGLSLMMWWLWIYWKSEPSLCRLSVHQDKMSIKKAINVDAAQGKRQNTNMKLWGNLGCGVAESASLCSLLSHSPSLLGWEHLSRWLKVLKLKVAWLSLYMSSFCPSSRSCCCQPSLGQCKRYALDVLFNQSSNTRCWAELEKWQLQHMGRDVDLPLLRRHSYRTAG